MLHRCLFPQQHRVILLWVTNTIMELEFIERGFTENEFVFEMEDKICKLGNTDDVNLVGQKKQT